VLHNSTVVPVAIAAPVAVDPAVVKDIIVGSAVERIPGSRSVITDIVLFSY
jgi:hypothetical protein